MGEVRQEVPNWGALHDLESLARRFGTPFYLYDFGLLRRQVECLRGGLGEGVELYYAVKANPNPSLLRRMREEQMVEGLDVASGGELRLALGAGWEAERLSFAGPGKRRVDLEEAVGLGVGRICVESMRELSLLAEIAGERGVRCRMMLRINPALEIHAFGMKIGGRANPFGIDEEAMETVFEALEKVGERLDFEGLHIHAGSQCFSAKAMGKNIEHALGIVARVEGMGHQVSCLNLGGGLGVSNWHPVRMIDVEALGGQLRRLCDESGYEGKIRFEPGRYLMGPAGIYVARVCSTKASRGSFFVVMDGGMNHFVAGGLREVGGMEKEVWVENLSRPDVPAQVVEICGPLCTPLDRIGHHVSVPVPEVGDLLGWPHAGAYGPTMSPLFFLGHATPPEILFDGAEYRLIRGSLEADAWGVTVR